MNIKQLIGTWIFVFLAMPVVFSFGVSPGREIFTYQPDAELEGSFLLINNENRDLQLGLEVVGPLQPYLSLEKTEVELRAGQSQRVHYTARLPTVLPSEDVDSMILVKESIPLKTPEGMSVLARGAVATQIAIRFTGPIQVAQRAQQPVREGSIDILSVALQSLATGDVVDVALSNDGEQLLSVVAEIVIYDGQREILRSASTYAVDPRSTAKIRLPLDISKLAPGVYQAKFVVRSGQRIIEKTFTLRTREKVLEEASVEELQMSEQPSNLRLFLIIVLVLVGFHIVLWTFFRRRKRKHDLF